MSSSSGSEDEKQKKWVEPPFNKGDMPNPLVEESSFATLFPKYREKYLREVEKDLGKYGIEATLDLREGTMTVKTTRRTWDPFAIFNARDLIKLLSRSVPLPQALKIFDDNVFCDIIKIGRITRNKERFVKRRDRLIGPNGQTLKAIELLSSCYVMIQGNTVSAMGSVKGLALVRKIVEDCMKNIHPIYNIKAEMIKREISKNPDMQNEDWSRFIPTFKKKNAQRKVKKTQKKKTKSVFPPPQQLRKVDMEMMSGEYFLSPHEKEAAKKREKEQKQSEKTQERKKQREKDFVAPKESKKTKNKGNNEELQESIAKIKNNAASSSKKRKASSDNLADYVDAPEKKKRRKSK